MGSYIKAVPNRHLHLYIVYDKIYLLPQYQFIKIPHISNLLLCNIKSKIQSIECEAVFKILKLPAGSTLQVVYIKTLQPQAFHSLIK